MVIFPKGCFPGTKENISSLPFIGGLSFSRVSRICCLAMEQHSLTSHVFLSQLSSWGTQRRNQSGICVVTDLEGTIRSLSDGDAAS